MSAVHESPFEPATSLEVESSSFQIARRSDFASQRLSINPADASSVAAVEESSELLPVVRLIISLGFFH
jgi:hypothetical protein